MKKVLITGANGFLGQHLCVFLSQHHYEVIACGRGASRLPHDLNISYRSVDLTHAEAVQDLVTHVQPDAIVHTAAMSKPDECHTNREEAWRQNVSATENLLRSAQIQIAAPHFIHVSTDFIFGENGPHEESEQPHPLNYYGETKLKAEEKVLAASLPTTVVRPVFIYGKQFEGSRPSFIHWVKASLEAGNEIKVVTDQRRTPTLATDICKGIETIINKQITGVFHLAGPDILSPYEMAVQTAKLLELNTELILPVTSETFPEVVRRAKFSGLKIEKARRELGYDPVSFEEGLAKSFKS